MKKDLVVWSTRLNLSACMRKYYYSEVLNKIPLMRPDYLDKGTMVHMMAAEYYRLKMAKHKEDLPINHAEMVDRSIDIGRQKVIEMDLEIQEAELCVKTWREYTSYYQNDPLIPIAVEEPFSEAIYEDEEVRVIFEGKLDILFENPLQDNLRLITDHKTGNRNQDPSALNNQSMEIGRAHV